MVTRSEARTPGYLGAAFIFQFATSLTAGMLAMPILAGGITEVLPNVSSSPGHLQTIIVLELLTGIGIIVMTSLLNIVLRDQNRPVALVALGLWFAEAVMLAVKTLGLYGLLMVSAAYLDAGTPTSSSTETIGTLCLGVSQHAADIGMLFFCLGGLLWYSLLLRSRIVPRLLPLWGLVAVALVLVTTALLVWDRSLEPSFAMYALYIPFELVLGLWLLIKGATVRAAHLNTGSVPAVLHGQQKDVGKAKEHRTTP